MYEDEFTFFLYSKHSGMGIKMTQEIREWLSEAAEAPYRDFSKSLIAECKPLLGVRLPLLRKKARELTNSGEWKKLTETDGAEDIYFEETMLRGMLIGYGTQKEQDNEEAMRLFDQFVPLVDNWSVCDSFCNSMTIVSAHRAEWWTHLQSFITSEKEFEVRTALVLLLSQFLKWDGTGRKIPRRRVITEADIMQDIVQKPKEQARNNSIECADNPYLEKIFSALDRPFTQGYYAQMAAAWLAAECFVMFPAQTMQFLIKAAMDDFTYNKALSKICESQNPAPEVKARIKSMKRRCKRDIV